MMPRCRIIVVALVVAAATLRPSPAWAKNKGTWFIVEVQGGVAESAYSGGGLGVAYGLSAGATVKFKSFPVRWYLLASVLGRNTWVQGRHQGIGFDAERRELDLFFALRTVVPVWRLLRVYVELGLGQRLLSQTIQRGEQLGSLNQSADHLLLVLGVGLQARLTNQFSVGLRGEITPLDAGPDLTTFAADLEPEPNRLSLFAQIALHF